MDEQNIEFCLQLLQEDFVPYIVRKSQVFKGQINYKDEFDECLLQIKKYEDAIGYLLRQFNQREDQIKIEIEELFENHQKEIQEIQEKLDYEQRRSNEYEKLFKDKYLQVKEQLDIIQELEQQITDKEEEILILKNINRRVTDPQKKQDSLQLLQNNQTIEDLKNQILNYKKELIQAKCEIDESKQQFQRQEKELEITLNKVKLLKKEKDTSDLKNKQLEQEIVKLHLTIQEQEIKCKTLESNVTSLDQQLYDLQNALYGKNYENNLESSTFIRPSIAESQLNTNFNELKSELPQLSYRQHTSQQQQFGVINEVSEIQEQSVQHSKQHTAVPEKFVNQFDSSDLSEKLQKLKDQSAFEFQTKRQSEVQSQNEAFIKKNQIEIDSVDDSDTFIYEQKVKPPSQKKQNNVKIPLLPINPPEEKNIVKNDINPFRRISNPNPSQNLFKEIYKANESYYIKMKQEQSKIIPEFNKNVRLSMVGPKMVQKQVVKRDPYQEFFDLLCQCVKLNSENFQEIFHINTKNYYQECLKSGKPYNQWEDWIRNKFQSLIDMQI